MSERFIRKPEHDKRIAQGDDWAGDAWLDTDYGLIVWVGVGGKPEAYQQQTWPGDKQ